MEAFESNQRSARTDELGAVVGEEILGQPALSHQAIENLDYMHAARTLTDFDDETFATEDTDDNQRTKLLPVAELVRDEVQAPGPVAPEIPAPPASGSRRSTQPNAASPSWQMTLLGPFPMSLQTS